MRRFLLPLVALAALAILPACDSGGDAVGVTGTWDGEIFDPSDASATRYPIELRMNDTGIRITGSGFVSGLLGDPELPDGRLGFFIEEGSFIEGRLTLTLQFDPPVPPFRGGIAGVLVNQDPGRIQGTFSGRGAANGDLTIELTAR